LFSALKADFDKEDVLRKLFWKARAKARVVLKEQLAEFRDKRAAGLGSIFGPPDQELKQCIDNRTKELHKFAKPYSYYIKLRGPGFSGSAKKFYSYVVFFAV
jgi:hypothetical protein